MKRWNTVTNEEVENPAIDAFLLDIVAVCEKHQLALLHEDINGAFEVATMTEAAFGWLMEAHDATGDHDSAPPPS